MNLTHSDKSAEQKKTGTSLNQGLVNDASALKKNSAENGSQNNVQQFINNSPQVQKGKALQSFINNSSYMVAQRKRLAVIENSTIQKQSEDNPKTNTSGMPDNLKSGIEHLSGMDIGDVNVHYNSQEPAELNAHAFAKGSDIHLGPGQEKHLPHEAWHVVKQKKGKVKPSVQLKGVSVNDDPHLEKEADEMGSKAMNVKTNAENDPLQMKSEKPDDIIQRKVFVGSKDAPEKINKIPKDLKDKGSGDKKMDTMLSDDVDRHFLSKQELENYMKNTTETIGVVDKEKTWVRLTEGELMVLGELHTQTVLTDVAKAVNTSRFAYEPYNDVPKDLKDTQSIEATDEAKWEKDAGMTSSDKDDHKMEFILPKLVFALEYIKNVILQGKMDDYKKTQDEQYNAAERLSHYLCMAMSISKDLAGEKKDKLEIVNLYNGNKDLIDGTIKEASAGTYLGDLQDMNKNKTNQNIVYSFCVSFIDYCIKDFESKESSESPDKNTIAAVEDIKKDNHSKSKNKSPISDDANTWREFYMYQNVLRAKGLNFLLAGMGDAHRKDMADKLSKVSGLKVMMMDDFIKNNKDNNDEVSKNAKPDKLTENEYHLMTHVGSGIDDSKKKYEGPLNKAALE